MADFTFYPDGDVRKDTYLEVLNRTERDESPDLNWTDVLNSTLSKSGYNWQKTPEGYNVARKNELMDSLKDAVWSEVASSPFAPNEEKGRVGIASAILYAMPDLDKQTALDLARGGGIQQELGLKYKRDGVLTAGVDTFMSSYYSAKAGDAFTLYMLDPSNEKALELAYKYENEALKRKTADSGYGWFADHFIMPYAKVSGQSFTSSGGATLLMLGGKAISVATGQAWAIPVFNSLAGIYSGVRAGSSQAGAEFFQLYKQFDDNGMRLDMTDPTVRSLFILDLIVQGAIEVGDFAWSPTYRMMKNIITPEALASQFAKSFWTGLSKVGREFLFSNFSESLEEFAGTIVSDAITNAVYDYNNRHKGTEFPLKRFQDTLMDAKDAFAQTFVEMIPTVAFNMSVTLGVQGARLLNASKNQTFSFDPNKKQGVLDSRYIAGSDRLRTQAQAEETQAKEAGETSGKPQEKVPQIKVVQTERGAVPATEEDAGNLKELYRRNKGKDSFSVIIEGVSEDTLKTEDRASVLNTMGAYLNGYEDSGDVLGYGGGSIIVSDEEAAERVRDTLSEEGLQRTAEGGDIVLVRDGVSTRIGVITQAQAEAQGLKYRPISTWQYANMRVKNATRVSAQEFLDQVEQQDALKTLIQRMTGMSAEEVNDAFENDVDSISMNLPDGVTWENLSASAMFMPVMSQITGRTTEDLLSDNLIQFDVTGRTEYVDLETQRSMTYNAETGNVELHDPETGEVIREYDPGDREHVGIAKADMSLKGEGAGRQFTIHVHRDAEAEDIMHELMHVTRSLASKERLSGFIRAYGAEDLWTDDIRDNGDGTWSFNGQTYGSRSEAYNLARANEERFVHDFMQYLYDGSAPNAETRSFFRSLRDFLRRFIDQFRDSLSQDTVRAFDMLLNGEVDPALGETLEEAVEASQRTLTDEVEEAAQEQVSEADEYTEDQYDSGLDENGNKLWSLAPADVVERFREEETVPAYRTMQLIDGELYPPKATYEKGKRGPKLIAGAHEGDVLMAEERPEMAYLKTTKEGRKYVFDLKDGVGTTAGVDYNPYFHSSSSIFNDQFTGAVNRPNQVLVEVRLLKSDLESGYRAEKANKPVGETSWHYGSLSAQLRAAGKGERTVYLSRYVKIERIVPAKEVASMMKKELEGTGIEIDARTVTPALRAELEKTGVAIDYSKLSDNTLYSLSSEAQSQYDEVVAKYRDTDQWLKAPNGKPTNLTERQWVMVRTPNFTRWFGDWINDPENASKVVDENGEPKVVYHWRYRIFDVFDMSRARQSMDIVGAYFSDNPTDTAEYGGWTGDPRDLPRLIREGKRVSAFLNIRNPIRNPKWDYGVTDTAGLDERNNLLAQGYDGAIRQYAEDEPAEYIAFNSNQIKSATDNIGDFSNENNSILYSLASDRQWQVMDANTQRRIDADYDRTYNEYYGTDKWMKAPNGQSTNLTERQWVQVRTPAFKEWFGDWENDPENSSKVIDENGEPLVVNHISIPIIDNETGNLISTNSDVFSRDAYENGFWFSDNVNLPKDLINGFAPFSEDYMTYGFLNIREPLIVDAGNQRWNWMEVGEQTDEYEEGCHNIYSTEGLANYAEDNGYDGLIIKNVKEGSTDYTVTDYAAFASNQIKSATDNVGAFSPDNGSILFSLAPAVGTEEFDQWFNGSKVVDAEGNPLVVYHGSPVRGIDEFSPEGRTNNGDGLIYATDERTVADVFSREHVPGSSSLSVRFTGNSGEVYPLYMSMKNPLDLRNLSEKEKQMLLDSYERIWHPSDARKTFDEVLEAGNHQLLKDMTWDVTRNLPAYGYDGLIANMLTNWQSEQYGGVNYTEYAVVSPEQVKRIAPVRVNRDSGYTTTTLYSLQNNDLPLDFFRNGGTIRYGENDGSEQRQSDTGRASDPAGLRGFIEFDLSDGGDNGRLSQWDLGGDEVQSGSHWSSQRPYLEAGDILPGERGPASGQYRNRLLQRLNSVKGTSYTGVFFYELNKTDSALNKFIKALDHARASNPTGLLVSPKTLSELRSDKVRVFLSGDGNTGYAIEYDHGDVAGLNNLVAVFNTSMNGETTRGAVYSILADAIEHGANVLDCYANEGLVRSYFQMGFVPTGRVKFTDEYLSDEEKKVFKKNKQQMQKPVIAMYYSDRGIDDTMDKLDGRKSAGWDEGFTISNYPADGYEAALRERDVIARDSLFGQGPEYRTDPENYRLGTRIGGTIGSNPSPLSEATGHGLLNWENIPGREDVAEKVAGNLMGGAYKVMKDGTELKLSSPIPVRRMAGEKAIGYLRRVANYGAQNIRTIFDAIHKDVLEREKKWYDTAHAFAVSMSQRYDLSIGQSAAVIAVLSPNYEWDPNLALADICLDILVNASDSVPSERMIQHAREEYGWGEERLEDFGKKTLSQMSENEAKDFIYLAIQSGEIDKSYLAGLRVGGGITGESGRRFGMTVGTGNMIKKVISVFRDGSLQNISDNIGSEAKVRSFYNNILMPWSDRGEITADTWALRDFFLGMNPKYSEEMRGILFQGQGGSGTGLTAVINEGFRIAADIISAGSEEKYLPQQIQSIVWTGIKSAWDNAAKAGMRDALNEAWENGDVDSIRTIFTDLINRYQPELDVAPAIEGQTLSRRAADSTIFREGTESARYNNLGDMIAESYSNTRQSAQAYQEAGGREGLSDNVLFSLSPKRRAEVLEQRKGEIQRAVEAGVYVSTDYLNEFRGEPWADEELELRDWMGDNPDVVSMAKDSDTEKAFRKRFEESSKKEGSGPAQLPDKDLEDEWLSKIFRYAHALSSADRDRQFAAEWTSSEDKTLELADVLRRYTADRYSRRQTGRSGGYRYVSGEYGALRGVSQKVRMLRDGSGRGERSTSEQIKEAQALILENPRAYRNAYAMASRGQESADTFDMELVDDDIAREMDRLEEEAAQRNRLRTDYRANLEDIRQKAADAEADLRKAGQDPRKADEESIRKDLQDIRQRTKELEGIIREAEEEVDALIGRMGSMIEDQEYRTMRAEQRADFLLAYGRNKNAQFKAAQRQLQDRRDRVTELRSQLTDANKQIRKLSNALDALRRWKEAKEASDYRIRRIRQIKRLSEFNPASIDAIYEDTLLWIRGLFERSEEDIGNRRDLTEQIALKKQEIERLSMQNEDTAQAKQELLNLQRQKKLSRMVEPPALLRTYLPEGVTMLRAENRQSLWTAEELDMILAALKQMRFDGRTLLENRQNQRNDRLRGTSYAYFSEVMGRPAALNDEGYMSTRALEEDVRQSLPEAEKSTGFRWFRLWNAKLQRLARILDGDREGVLYNWFVRTAYRRQSQEISGKNTRYSGADAFLKELAKQGFNLSSLSKEGYKGEKGNGTKYSLTRGQMLGVYIYSLSDLGMEKLTDINGNYLTEKTVRDIVSQLTPQETAWARFMMEDMQENYGRLRDVYYRGWNMNLGQRDNYFTLVPSESVSDKDLDRTGMDPQGDLVGRDGKVYAERGFTKNVNPNAIYPLDLDATRTWFRQVAKQEHFIAYGEWAKDSQFLLDQGSMKELMARRFGQTEADNFQKIVNNIIGGEMSNNDFDRSWTKFLAKRNSAVLIGNTGVIVKQAPSWFAAFNGDITTKALSMATVGGRGALQDFLGQHPEIAALLPDKFDGKITSFIHAVAPEMKNRQIDLDIVEALNRMDSNAVQNAVRITSDRIAKFTIQLVDKMVVNNLWMGRYYTVFAEQKKKGKSDADAHREAAFKASQMISETQPTSMRMDQSASQIDAKTSSFLRAVMVFTNQAINTFNQMFLDIPMAFRRKEGLKVMAKVVSSMLMISSMALLSGKFIRRSGEDDEEYLFRVAREALSVGLQSGLPGFGAIAAHAIEYNSDFSTYIFGLDTFGKSVKTLLSPTKKKGFAEKLGDALIDIATEAGYAVGVPVSPFKNVMRTIESGNPAYLITSTWGQISESYR